MCVCALVEIVYVWEEISVDSVFVVVVNICVCCGVCLLRCGCVCMCLLRLACLYLLRSVCTCMLAEV